MLSKRPREDRSAERDADPPAAKKRRSAVAPAPPSPGAVADPLTADRAPIGNAGRPEHGQRAFFLAAAAAATASTALASQSSACNTNYSFLFIRDPVIRSDPTPSRKMCVPVTRSSFPEAGAGGDFSRMYPDLRRASIFETGAAGLFAKHLPLLAALNQAQLNNVLNVSSRV